MELKEPMERAGDLAVVPPPALQAQGPDFDP